jgi:nitrate reductase alpha subunit
VLIEMFREAKARLGGDPVAAGPTSRRPGPARTYQRARGKGG